MMHKEFVVGSPLYLQLIAQLEAQLKTATFVDIEVGPCGKCYSCTECGEGCARAAEFICLEVDEVLPDGSSWYPENFFIEAASLPQDDYENHAALATHLVQNIDCAGTCYELRDALAQDPGKYRPTLTEEEFAAAYAPAEKLFTYTVKRYVNPWRHREETEEKEASW